MRTDGQPLEIERKYLIRYPEESWLDGLPGSSRAELVQTYLKSADGETQRVRTWTENGRTLRYHTVKRRLTDLTRIEEEREITETEYQELLREEDPDRRPIRKTRWRVPYEGHLLEIDLYPFWQNQAVLECELESEEEEARFPSELRIIREVTADARYLNSSLARNIPEEDIL